MPNSLPNQLNLPKSFGGTLMAWYNYLGTLLMFHSMECKRYDKAKPQTAVPKIRNYGIGQYGHIDQMAINNQDFFEN